MARRSAIVIAAAFLTVLIVPAIPAAAGGGCHSGRDPGQRETPSSSSTPARHPRS